MSDPAVSEREVTRVHGDSRSAERDAVAVEAPLELRAGGE